MFVKNHLAFAFNTSSCNTLQLLTSFQAAPALPFIDLPLHTALTRTPISIHTLYMFS